LIDLTHGRALMRLTGADSARLLAKLCSIDLSDHMAPNGAAFRATIAKLVTDVIRDDIESTRSYLLHCETSSGQYLFDTLFDAGVEFGIEVDGWPDLDQGLFPVGLPGR
jgi:heterotetrameric sarcosine oxidase gamma subunit